MVICLAMNNDVAHVLKEFIGEALERSDTSFERRALDAIVETIENGGGVVVVEDSNYEEESS